jgi:protein-disulfide isomerase
MRTKWSMPELRRNRILNLLSVVVAVAVCAVVTWGESHVRPPVGTEGGPLPTQPVSLEGAALEGQPTAQLGMVVFSDFQCPFCGLFARDVLPTIRDRYVSSGRILLAFRNLPLTSIHSEAWSAATAAFCANLAGRFWQVHDSLFADQRKLAEEFIDRRAEGAGLSLVDFRACQKSREAEAAIRRDVAVADSLAIVATPTILLGTLAPDGQLVVSHRYSGAPSLDELGAAVAQLSKRGRAVTENLQPGGGEKR